MNRKQFWLTIIFSSIISASIVMVTTQWAFSPASPAEALTESGHSAVVANEPSAAPTPAPVAVRPQNSLSSEEETNIRIYRELSQSVVNVTSTRLRYNFWMRVVPEQGSGSGFIINREGYSVTNNHVIEEGQQIEVTLFDETVLEAEIVGRDPINDIAVLKVDCPPGKCVPIPLARDHQLLVGQKVLAIGNPFGLDRTLTTGIISSVGRSLESEHGVLEDLIQTDAAINPGNSGGPLLNTRGEVIGVNTALISRSGESAGIGFAVPVSTVASILPDLLEHGEVRRAWLGIISGRTVGKRLAQVLKLPVSEGFLIEQIAHGSSADIAGLRGGNKRVWAGNVPLVIGGDVLIEINGKPIRSAKDILRVSQGLRPDKEVELVYYRGDRKVTTHSELIGRRSSQKRFRF